MSRLTIIGGACIAFLVAGFFGGTSYQKGQQAKIDLKQQIAQVAVGTALAAKETQRLAVEAENTALAQKLEDLAHADPVDDSCGIDVDRVLRLKLR
jgi:hypothetical protein